MSTRLALFALAALVLPSFAQPLTNVFTYQSELKVSGAPATGAHDLQFKLFDAATLGNQLGLTLCVNDAIPSGGRFTAQLDFGAVFNGQRRFLEVSVRADAGGATACAVTTGYTLLTPRQEVTLTPYAAFALNAAAATTATTATSATTAFTATNSTQLNGQNAAFYQSAANLNAGTLSDTRLSANVALLGTTQTFSAVKTFSAAPAFTGATPFTVASSTLVGNLNADLLDGQSGAFYQNAANLSAGTLPDARLSTNVVVLAGTQSITGGKIFLAPVAFNGFVPFTVTSTSVVGNLNADLLDNQTGSFYQHASNISTGTLADDRLSTNIPRLNSVQLFTNSNTFTSPSNSFTGQGSGLTSLNGSNISQGTLADARLTSNVALLGPSQIFTGANTFDATTTFNNTVVLNFGGRTLEIRNESGLVPGLNLTGSTGILGVLRLRNALEIWPNDAATAPGAFDIRNTAGAPTFSVDGAGGSMVASGSIDVDAASQNDGTFSSGILRIGGTGSGEGIASNRTSDANGNRYGMDFYTGNGTRRMSISVDGKVGIGTSSPQGLLQVGEQTAGSTGEVVIPGPATAGLTYTNVGDAPRQTFVAPFDADILSIDVTVSNTGSSRLTSLTLTGPSVNAPANSVNIGSNASPQVIMYTFNSPWPHIVAGQTYTWTWLGGPLDGNSRAWYRNDNPYASGQGAGVGLPANSDFVCTIRTTAVGTGIPPALIVTSDRKTGIGTATPSSTLTVLGNAQISGTLSKGGGSFQIDHPLDPGNKFLFHSFVESPDMMNIYNGNARTDAAGFATITLPEWFSALNRDFRYQLTVIDEAAPDAHFARIARKLSSDNTFAIRTIPGNLEVSWQITGIRHDAFANANRIPVEVEKPAADKGKYLHPEAHDKPAVLGIYQSR